MKVDLSFESKCVAYLVALPHEDDGQASAPATGFFWRYEDRLYLVTNRHVVTGRDGKNIPLPSGFDPHYINAYFYKKSGIINPGYTEVVHTGIKLELYKDCQKDWLEHKSGLNYDIAILEISPPLDVFAVNDKEQREDIWIEAGADCFIVGFPERLTGPEATPIWKRASIASKPSLNYNSEPVFLCDTASRPGMSGSPVFAKAYGDFGREGTERRTKFFGFWTKFIGIYSGRNGANQDGFQLGRVWRPEIIEQIIQEPKVW